MKKLICFSLAMAVTSVVLLFKSAPPQIDEDTLEKSKHSETPLHIFKEEEKKSEVTVKKPKTNWVKENSKPARKQVRKVDQVLALKAPSKIEAPIVSEKSWQDSISEKSPVPVLKAPDAKANSPWLHELSGESANLNLAKKAVKKEECVSSQCGEAAKSINVVGVVVETERFHKKSESLVAGNFHLGDAKQLPVVYIK